MNLYSGKAFLNIKSTQNENLRKLLPKALKFQEPNKKHN